MAFQLLMISLYRKLTLIIELSYSKMKPNLMRDFFSLPCFKQSWKPIDELHGPQVVSWEAKKAVISFPVWAASSWNKSKVVAWHINMQREFRGEGSSNWWSNFNRFSALAHGSLKSCCGGESYRELKRWNWFRITVELLKTTLTIRVDLITGVLRTGSHRSIIMLI